MAAVAVGQAEETVSGFLVSQAQQFRIRCAGLRGRNRDACTARSAGRAHRAQREAAKGCSTEPGFYLVPRVQGYFTKKRLGKAGLANGKVSLESFPVSPPMGLMQTLCITLCFTPLLCPLSPHHRALGHSTGAFRDVELPRPCALPSHLSNRRSNC